MSNKNCTYIFGIISGFCMLIFETNQNRYLKSKLYFLSRHRTKNVFVCDMIVKAMCLKCYVIFLVWFTTVIIENMLSLQNKVNGAYMFISFCVIFKYMYKYSYDCRETILLHFFDISYHNYKYRLHHYQGINILDRST